MTQAEVLGIFNEAIWVALKLSAPFLIISVAVGLVIAVFQAATQIHEQTLTFVPKIVAISVLLLVCGTWMINVMNDFIQGLFSTIANL